MTKRPSRRDFIRVLGTGAVTLPFALALAQPRQSDDDSPYQVMVPPFMTSLISDEALAYLNAIIPVLFDTYKDLLPALDAPPPYVMLNTMNETLVNHGGVYIAQELLGGEALTLIDAQYLLATTRFGSVATPHRGKDVAMYGKVVYLKQHPQTGYYTPEHLLLEEMLHVQQDVTVMRGIIQREELDPVGCLHAQLKGISELGAHYYIEALAGEADYVFVLDDGTHCTDAADAVQQLTSRLGTDRDTLLRALLYDVNAYTELDQVAQEQDSKHIWQMITTWRHARDAEGNATAIAPAFQPF